MAWNVFTLVPRTALCRWRLALCTLVMSVVAATGSGVGWAATYDPATDMNSMFNTTLYTGAQTWWSAGYTGAGVDIALIDTGVSPVEGLATPGKIVYGPDLSFESQSPDLEHLDTNGHGTFMAGLIAGKGSALMRRTRTRPQASTGESPRMRGSSRSRSVSPTGVSTSAR